MDMYMHVLYNIPSKSNVPSLWRSMFFQWIEYHPINILHKFQIDISSKSREIKYQTSYGIFFWEINLLIKKLNSENDDNSRL